MASAPRNRSKVHPAIGLSEACATLREYVERVGWQSEHTRDEMIGLMGYAKSSGAALRRIAALKHFGLITQHSGSYRPSDIGRRILEASDNQKRRNALRGAFLSPTLYREVVNRYRSDGALPPDLARALAKDHGITESAKKRAAKNLLDSAQFASVMTADGVFLGDFLRRGVGSAAIEPNETGPSARSIDFESRRNPPEQPVTEERFRTFQMYLGGYRSVELKVPPKLDTDDVDALRELLEIQLQLIKAEIKANKPGRTVRFPSTQKG